ncbi:MAG: cytochrome c family protein [Syntrophorhabdales bacterium]|jgi:hypothetical protein
MGRLILTVNQARLFLLAAPLFVLLLPALTSSAAGPEAYLGWETCAPCHEKVTKEWQKDRHAQAFEDLKKSGQEELPNCIPCHSTGCGQPGGFIDKELTPELAGVQCEECHGPGRRHAAAPGKENIIGVPGIATCRRCHTASQDPGFDYGRKAKLVHSPH